MTTYLATFSEPVEWVTYRDKWDDETQTWIDNGKEIHHSDTRVEFYSATDAKRFIKQHMDVFVGCNIYKIYSNGDMVNCGELNIKGSNSHHIENSPRNMKGYNY